MSWTMVAVVIAWILGGFFAFVFQCGHTIPNLWTSAANVASHCSSGAAIGLGFAIPDFITDGFILAMPLYWVCGLHLYGIQCANFGVDFAIADVLLEEA